VVNFVLELDLGVVGEGGELRCIYITCPLVEIQLVATLAEICPNETVAAQPNHFLLCASRAGWIVTCCLLPIGPEEAHRQVGPAIPL
jgi:hypothetical protein